MLECQTKWAEDLKGESVETGKELEDVARTVGQGVTDFAAVVAFDHQAGDDQPAQVLAGRFHFDLQMLANIPHAKLRTRRQEFENLNASVVGKTFDRALETLAPHPLAPHHAFDR